MAADAIRALAARRHIFGEPNLPVEVPWTQSQSAQSTPSHMCQDNSAVQDSGPPDVMSVRKWYLFRAFQSVMEILLYRRRYKLISVSDRVRGFLSPICPALDNAPEESRAFQEFLRVYEDWSYDRILGDLNCHCTSDTESVRVVYTSEKSPAGIREMHSDIRKDRTTTRIILVLETASPGRDVITLRNNINDITMKLRSRQRPDTVVDMVRTKKRKKSTRDKDEEEEDASVQLRSSEGLALPILSKTETVVNKTEVLYKDGETMPLLETFSIEGQLSCHFQRNKYFPRVAAVVSDRNEVETLNTTLMLRSIAQLPKLFVTDPLAVVYGAMKNDTVRVSELVNDKGLSWRYMYTVNDNNRVHARLRRRGA
jgi:DNA-directed RNA polymerase subunit H (RpoH/RPB5)